MAKKIVSMMLVLMMVLSSAAFAEGTAHIHAPAEEWERDLRQHWHACECGEKLEAEEHAFSDIRCTVCGSEVWEFEDGSGDVNNFDEHDQLIRYTYFDSEGNIVDDYRYLREYNDAYCTREEVYLGETLIEVTEYVMHPDEYVIPSLQTYYDPEGGRSINEYDEYGNIIRSAVYDADDALLYEDITEYTYDEEGWILESRQTGYFDGVLSYKSVDNQYGDNVLSAYYNTDSTLNFGSRSEYEYDEDGNKLREKLYDLADDSLQQESIFALEMIDDELWHYEKQFICYEEDGSKVVYESDQNGNELTETIYNAAGEIETVYSNEYEFDQDGNLFRHYRCENGRLYQITQYEIVDTEDWYYSYQHIITELYEDGSSYTCVYDEDGNLIDEGYFDGNGDSVIHVQDTSDESMMLFAIEGIFGAALFLYGLGIFR